MNGRKSKVLGVMAVTIVLLSLTVQIVLPSSSGQPSLQPRAGVQPSLSATDFPNQNITLHSAGATFPAPIIFNWTAAYHRINPTVSISYQAVGSGAGIASLINKTGDFAASDAPLNSGQRLLAPNVLHIPETIGSVVAAYNLGGSGIGTGLNFTGNVLARIYYGNITKWNDPAIMTLNPHISLPNNNITVVWRQDGSGTSFVWTSFLCQASATFCSLIGGASTKPKILVGVTANHNDGVANFVSSHPNAIGYVELNYALSHGLNYGQIQNPAGTFVLPTLTTTRYAVSNSTQTLPSGSGDWSHVSLLNAAGLNTYPIASFTYFLVYQELNVVPSMDLNETAQKNALIAFLNWVVTTGQNSTYTDTLSYVALPPQVVAVDQASINSIKFTITSTPVSRTFALRADASLGWNSSTVNPNPTITVVSGDTVTLNLFSNDGLTHHWFIDFDNNLLADANEAATTSPAFSSTTTAMPFTLTPTISGNIPLAGLANAGYRFTYRDVDYPGNSGTIAVLPQQYTAVLKPASSLTYKFAPVIDSSRVTSIGTLVIDTRAQTVSGNVTIVTVDSVSGSLTDNKTFTIPNLALFRQQLKFIMVATKVATQTLPAVSSNILVQSVSPGISATASVYTTTRNLDVNGFGVVNIGDVTVAGTAYNCALGQPCYNAKADFKALGVINIYDISVIAFFYTAPAFS